MMRVLILVAAVGSCSLAGAQELGRLFLTPEQRESLDARRRARLPDRPPAAVYSPTTRFDGHVERAGGRSTIWLNGTPVPEGQQPEGYRVTIRKGAPGQAVVGSAESERGSRMKVGESLDTGSGEVRPSHGDGRVEVVRPAAGRR